jgi:hypothetical protein
MKVYSFATTSTATIDGIINLVGTRAPVTVSIRRYPETSVIGNMCRLSTEVLLSIAAAYPLEEGERIEVSGLGPRSRSSEMATITYTGQRTRGVEVKRDFPNARKQRMLHLVCDINVPADELPLGWPSNDLWTYGKPLEMAMGEETARFLCRDLRERKHQAARGCLGLAVELMTTKWGFPPSHGYFEWVGDRDRQ